MNGNSGSKEEYWQRHQERQKNSGLSQRGCCRSEGLSLSQFSYWNRKARKGPERQEASRLTQVPVELTEPSGEAIEIEVPGRYVVRLPGNVGEDQLLVVLKAVESLR